MNGFVIGQRVFFWTGRGSQGHGTIRATKGDRFLIDPEPDAVKGSDHRILSSGREVWGPRDQGVRGYQLNTPPRPWLENS
ncbi:hypothetical protein [Sphingomonas crocodyli]|uniref:Uncharacterized protein n=1 Tax=Sphingomonas crocodyli TaxID=1979270 RepID=A0A437M6E7_9SPHN|nr:hypothetical protein [Sphingomonas crocodyli]RVT93126.1 hypothetical protein EOD43_04310 [Sphingomonas crocodyli]